MVIVLNVPLIVMVAPPLSGTSHVSAANVVNADSASSASHHRRPANPARGRVRNGGRPVGRSSCGRRDCRSRLLGCLRRGQLGPRPASRPARAGCRRCLRPPARRPGVPLTRWSSPVVGTGLGSAPAVPTGPSSRPDSSSLAGAGGSGWRPRRATRRAMSPEAGRLSGRGAGSGVESSGTALVRLGVGRWCGHRRRRCPGDTAVLISLSTARTDGCRCDRARARIRGRAH